MNKDRNIQLCKHLNLALNARKDLLDAQECSAFRLFNGFYEGYPELVVDLYASTLVLFSHAKSSEFGQNFLNAVQDFLLEQLSWITCVIQKERFARDRFLRRGQITFGDTASDRVREHGVWYAVDLLLNQDASFYLDTRNLRQWLLRLADGWTVFNAFAHTGSLGIAALSTGAKQVIQVDRSQKFLSLARNSGMLNHLDIGRMKLLAGDFFSHVAKLKRMGMLFDCVIIDPPIFSQTEKGTINLVSESVRLINKVRPLVKDGGYLVVVNNALFLSGAMYMRSLEGLCKDGYLFIEDLIPVPKDITGYRQTIVNSPPTDPSPFNHPTKITVLRVKRK